MRLKQPRVFASIEEAEEHPSKVRDVFLKHVDLRQCEGRLAQFARLEALTFGWCLGAELPEDIRSLKRLKFLRVLNAQLDTFPMWLSEIPKLRTLIIRGTMIPSIPSDVKFLSHLRSIDFGRNGLTSVPRELGELTQLRELFLTDNRLSALPDEILRLPRLKVLGLAGTNFSEDGVKRIKTPFPNAAVWPAVAIGPPVEGSS